MKIVHIPVDDIDTDQIIPARFLKGTTKAGLGVHLFADWPDRPARGAEILVAGVNFGCGSSREHAAWALTDFGFRAIVARSFADIFRENAFKNGLLTIELPDAACRELAGDVTIDLAAQRIACRHLRPAGSTAEWRCGSITSFEFAIDPFAKHCLLTGLDELGYLLSHADAITAHELLS